MSEERGLATDQLDENFARNMVRLREAAGMSQAEIVQRLRDTGWRNVHPTTISRIEKQERPVKLSEAAHIAEVLNQDLTRMITRPARAGAEEELDKWIGRVAENYNRMIGAAYRLITYRVGLRRALDDFAELVAREGDTRMREKLEQSRLFLGLRIDSGIANVRTAREDRSIKGFDEFADRYFANPQNLPPDPIDEEAINAKQA
ncbi:helix-turn-helix transcriptional regulator [Mycolicibacterium fortuitum]|uniref:helix-turn-helix domain-containing protein n=1 Tax=Mycolicibacterium fortuitum TaxID=1766 RepID=UPI0014904C54|nr:helix-turn-helix transcriptional regulator [Mycolicibacterium fortuitum]